MNFSIGDLIVYGETGVCRVEEIVERPFLDEVKNCYKLQPIFQSCVIFTPVDNLNVFMRKIITKEEAETILSNLGNIEPKELPVGSPRYLTEEYDKIIKLHDCSALAVFSVSIRAKRKKLSEQKKKFSSIDERYMKKSDELLFGELASALGLEKSEVRIMAEEKFNV